MFRRSNEPDGPAPRGPSMPALTSPAPAGPSYHQPWTGGQSSQFQPPHTLQSTVAFVEQTGRSPVAGLSPGDAGLMLATAAGPSSPNPYYPYTATAAASPATQLPIHGSAAGGGATYVNHPQTIPLALAVKAPTPGVAYAHQHKQYGTVTQDARLPPPLPPPPLPNQQHQQTLVPFPPQLQSYVPTYQHQHQVLYPSQPQPPLQPLSAPQHQQQQHWQLLYPPQQQQQSQPQQQPQPQQIPQAGPPPGQAPLRPLQSGSPAGVVAQGQPPRPLQPLIPVTALPPPPPPPPPPHQIRQLQPQQSLIPMGQAPQQLQQQRQWPQQPMQPLQPLQPPPRVSLPPPNPFLVADLTAAAAAAAVEEEEMPDEDGGGAAPSGSWQRSPPVAAAAELLPPSASPLLREVVSEGRLYVLDTSSQLVYRDSAQAGVLERVGKWVQGRVVFVPPLSEVDFFAGLRSFLSRRQLGLADLFAALDADLDGALAAGGELRALLAHVVPGAVPSEVSYLTALLDWDDDGYVGLADVLDADEWAERVAEERAEGGASALVHVLQETSFLLHTQRQHARTVFRSLAGGAAAAAAAVADPAALARALADEVDDDDDDGDRHYHQHPDHLHPGARRRTALLEPAALLRFLRVMRPELGPGEARYVMDHLLQGPGDNRRSLRQVLHTLHLADAAYAAEQKQAGEQQEQGQQEQEQQQGHGQGQQPHRQRIGGGKRQPGPGQGQGQQRARGPLLEQPRPPPLGPSRLRRRGGGPREAVPRFFYHLGYYLRSCRLTLRELVTQFDSDRDGALDPQDVRALLREVLPGLTADQAVYIRAAVSSPTAALVTVQDLNRAVQEHSPEFTAGRDDAAAAAAGFAPSSALAPQYLQSAAAGPGGAAAGGAEAYLAQQRKQLATAGLSAAGVGGPPADGLRWMLEYMSRQKVQLSTLVAQFDVDGDGLLGPNDAARLLQYLAAGRLVRQRPLDLALQRLLVEADLDHDGSLSYNDLRLALMAKQESLAKEHVRHANEEAAARAAATTTAVLLGPTEPALPATLRRPPSPGGGGGGNPDAVHPFWVRPNITAAWSSGGGAATSAAQAPAVMAQYRGLLPPGTAVEDYDATPHSPAHPHDTQDPFTLAFAAQNPAASSLPYSTLAIFPAPPLPLPPTGSGSFGGDGRPMGHQPGMVFPGDVPLCDVQPLDPDVTLIPVDYLGIRLLSDPVSGLTYLPLPRPTGSPAHLARTELRERARAAGQIPAEEEGEDGQEALHLFGRLLPNGTLERVETPLSAALFAALDNHLRASRTKLEDVWAAAVGGGGTGGAAATAISRPRHAAAAAPPAPPPPPADALALSRFLRLLLPDLDPVQATYLAALLDLDGDGLVWPDDLVMAFEEIGTAIDTPASKLNAQAYKLLARVAGVALGDYEESYRAFLRYSGALRQPRRRHVDGAKGGRGGSAKGEERIKEEGELYKDKGKKEKKGKDEGMKKKKKDESDGSGDAETVSSEGGGSGSSRSSSSSRSSRSTAMDEVELDVLEMEVEGPLELTQPQLARFLSHLTNHSAAPSDVGALVVYLNLKLADADGRGGGAAGAVAARPGPNQPYGNPYGNPRPYRRLREAPPTFDWPFLVGVFRSAETSLPVDRRAASPPTRRRMARDEVSERAAAKTAAKAAAAAAAAEERVAQAARRAAEEEEAAEAAAAWGRATGRSPPLRTTALTQPPAPHPDRRLVELALHIHTDGRTFLLDPVTGLLYGATPYILAAMDAVADATAEAAVPALSLRLLGGPVGGRADEANGHYSYTYFAGGAAAAAATASAGSSLPSPPPALLLPWPDLAGKLQYPDNRLLPAQSGSGVALVCGAVERLAAGEQRAAALYKVLDRDGRGLDPPRLRQLISDAASLTAAEVAFAGALLDRLGSGRVTLEELRKGAEMVRYTATELTAAGPSSRPARAAPVTLSLSRMEARARDVLHRAAQALQREARLMWLLVGKETGAAGTGQLDRAGAAALLQQVLQPYMPPYEIYVVTSYLAMMAPDKDGSITADEIVQLMRALPMRLPLPYSEFAGGIGGGGATAREIIFAAGFGGPVAADGTLPPILPSENGGGVAASGRGGGSISPYNRKLRLPTGPTNAEPELLYGPNDGAVFPDPNMPYDPDWGDGPYGRAADAMARKPPPRRPNQLDRHKGGTATATPAERRHAQEAVGQYGLYDDTEPDNMYDTAHLPPPASAARKKTLAMGPRRPHDNVGGIRTAAAVVEGRSVGAPAVSMSLQQEADLVDQLRGRPPRKLQPGGGGGVGGDGAAVAGYDSGTQYGLLTDVQQPSSTRASAVRGGGGFAGGGSGGGFGSIDGSRRASGDFSIEAQAVAPPPSPPLPYLPINASQRLLPEMPFVGPSPRLPDMSPRLPERPVGPSPRLPGGRGGRGANAVSSADSVGGDSVYDSVERPLAERPATLHTSPAAGGGQPAEVLSFLDGDSGSSGGGGAAAASSVDVSGGRRLMPPADSGYLRETAVVDPYGDPYGGMQDDDMVNAGSVPPSRPMTAATLARVSTADVPRLASPALDSLLGPARRSRVGAGLSASADIVAHDKDEYDPYSSDGGREPGAVAHHLSGLLHPARVREVAAATAVSSASGPALLTSFGDAFRDGPDGGRHGSGGSGGSGDGTLGPSYSSLLLPPSSFRPGTATATAAARSRLARSTIAGDDDDLPPPPRPPPPQRDEEDEDDDDPYAEDDSAAGAAELSGRVISPQSGGGGALGEAGGGGSMFNASIRSQTATSPLGVNIRSGGAADRYNSPGKGAGGGGGGVGAMPGDSSSGRSSSAAAVGGGGGGRGSGLYGLDAEGAMGGGGGSDEDEGARLLAYDEAELGVGEGDEVDFGLGAEAGDGF